MMHKITWITGQSGAKRLSTCTYIPTLLLQRQRPARLINCNYR